MDEVTQAGGTLKVLNLYAGIGGNRKLWEDVEVTAVELDPKIAKIYKDFFPNDEVIVGDAHQYLLEHFKEFEFIWSSPPCPTHSQFCFLNFNKGWGGGYKYPDMKLYEEVIFLKHWFNGKFCVENVISYFDPLIRPMESASHYFWTNFFFSLWENSHRGIMGGEIEFRKKRVGFDLDKYNLTKDFHKKIINNCVEPELGLHILNESKREVCQDLFK